MLILSVPQKNVMNLNSVIDVAKFVCIDISYVCNLVLTCVGGFGRNRITLAYLVSEQVYSK